MNIREALEETGMAMLHDIRDQQQWYAELNGDALKWTTPSNSEGVYQRQVWFSELMREDWTPYYKVKEIRPEKAGELWEHHGVIFMFVVDATVSYMKSSLPNKIGTVSKEGWQLKAIHGKNGWTRLYPPVEDDSVERIEVEDCILYETQYQPPEYKFVNYTFRMDDERLDGISKAKFIIEIPKEKP